MNPTNDPKLRSFIDVDANSHFPIQNLPYCSFRRPAEPEPRIGIRIGEYLLDLAVLEHDGFFRDTVLGETHVFCKRTLNKFMAQGSPAWSEVRQKLSLLLRHDSPTLRDDASLRRRCLVPLPEAELSLPAAIGDFTDFYSSKHHAFNVGTLFRGPEQALQPNYLWVPVAYHGRAGSIVLSGTDLHRPHGQLKRAEADPPLCGPSAQVDFELEVGFFTGPGNALGTPIPIGEAPAHIFGLVLVNDWSARDIQKWEYVPLGPFLGKNFGTSISPYVVPLAALEPFRCAGPVQEPAPLPYLRAADHATYDIQLEVCLQGARMPAPQVICRSNFKHLYWSMAQQLAHHTVNGCNIRPGDLLSSGTISGPAPEARGCLLELTSNGKQPLRLTAGEERAFLADGDCVTLTGWCAGDGYRVGFGEVTGRVLPARACDT
jgi:fumarylacetoacetase